MKSKLLVLAIAAMTTGNVYAADVSALSMTDVKVAFTQEAKPLQVSTLSNKEMKTTEGAFGTEPVYMTIGGKSGTTCYNSIAGRVCY